MKSIITLLLSVFIVNSNFAQTDIVSQRFIKSVITEKGVVYTDSLDKYEMNNMIMAFNQEGRYKNASKGFKRIDTPSIQIVFTGEEKAYINLELYNLKFHEWDKNLFENSTRIPVDTVSKIFSDNRKYGWLYFYNHYGNKLYSFSKPIFLRNGTMCLFYSDYSCGGTCGEGNFYIYLKIDGEWKPICRLFGWIS